MINLLPPNEKSQLHAARTNTLLVRYHFFLVGAIAFLGGAIGIAYLYLSNTKASAEQAIAQNTTQVSSYAAIETRAQQFRSNLATAKEILGREVTYTKVILEIARLLPRGVVLDDLSLDAQTFGTETTLAAQAKDYASALALKDSFQKSSLFTNVHFASITVSEGGDAANYPVAVNLNVTIKKDAAK
jgi:Tfp pilus assembly protein PilN